MKSPLLPYIRQDGRPLLITNRLQFVPGFGAVEKATGLEILEPGLIIGAVIRCHWNDFVHRKYTWETDAGRSMRIHLSGTYGGESNRIDYSAGDGTVHTALAPVFEMKAWRHDGLQVPVGAVTVAYLVEDQPAGLLGVDMRALHKALPEPSKGTAPTPHTVQIGGLYYVPTSTMTPIMQP